MCIRDRLSSVVALPNVTLFASVVHAFASTLTETAAGAVIVGSILSTTVTVAVSEKEFPLSSSTVRVTVTGVPTSLQLNESISIDKVGESSQLSVDESSTSEAVIVAAPLASNSTVMFCTDAVGAVVS